jgi:CheY-like chemotaxis protein
MLSPARFVKYSMPLSRAAMTILFADDSAVTQSLVQPILEAHGHEVATVENGTEAWELWQRAQHRVVVADWSMPGSPRRKRAPRSWMCADRAHA